MSEYEPRSKGRLRARLNKLLRPPKPEKIEETMAAIETWERQVKEYEKAFKKPLDEEIRIGVITFLAPDKVEEHLHLHADKYNTYADARKVVEDYVEAHIKEDERDDGGTKPMDIDVLEKRLHALEKGKGGKGKAKGKGKPTKGKGKGKKGDGKGKFKGKGKSAGGGVANNGGNGAIEGYCGSCGKWGHAQRDCWWSQSQQRSVNLIEAEQGAATEQPERVVNALTRTGVEEENFMFTMEKHEIEPDEKKMLLSHVRAGAGRTRFLVDSCADGSVCNSTFASQYELTYGKVDSFVSATGDSLDAVGLKNIELQEPGGGFYIKKQFQVTDRNNLPKDPVMSVGEITDNNCRVVFEKDGGYMENLETLHRIKFYRKNNIYELFMDLKEPDEMKEKYMFPLPASGADEDDPLPAAGVDPLPAAGVDEADGASSEAWPAKPIASPCTPTSAEVEAHSLTHLPYRSWCVHCVRAKGRAGAHKAKEEETHTLPRLSVDYLFPSQAKDARPLTGLSFYDKKAKRLAATLVPKKGTSEHPYPAKWLAHQVEFLGYPRVIVKSDQEPAIISLKRGAKEKLHGLEMTMEESPAGDSKSNGEIESYNNVLEGQIRVFKDQLDCNYKKSIDSEHTVLSWLVPFAAWTH